MQTIGLHSDSINEIIQKKTLVDERAAKLDQLNHKHQLEKQRSIFRRIEKYLAPWLLDKSAVCRHDQGCLENGIRRWLRTFMNAFGLIMLIKVLSMGSKPQRMIKAL